MSLIQLPNYLIVPKELESNFVKEVTDQYFNTFLKSSDRNMLTSEAHIVDEMVGMLNQVIAVEENIPQERLPGFDRFMHDIIIVLERSKVSYHRFLDDTYQNLPIQWVW